MYYLTIHISAIISEGHSHSSSIYIDTSNF